MESRHLPSHHQDNPFVVFVLPPCCAQPPLIICINNKKALVQHAQGVWLLTVIIPITTHNTGYWVLIIIVEVCQCY